MARFLQPRYRLECALIVPRTIEEIFAVFEDPRNLSRITPSWLNFRILTPEPIVMARGLILDYQIRWLGIPMPWRTLITAYQPPLQFVDEQTRGPFTVWRHVHTFREVSGGIEVADSVEYQLPFGPLGTLAHSAMVRGQLLAIFRFRQKAIGQILGVPGATMQEPRIRVVVDERAETRSSRAQ